MDKSSVEKQQSASEKNIFFEMNDLFEGLDYREVSALQEMIYENYASAMKRREREPLESDKFIYHFFQGGNHEQFLGFGSNKDGFLLGNEVNSVFIPTHFAPLGLKQGYRLIKELVDSDRPSALFITQDLVDTIKKMKGWKILPVKIKANFRGNNVEKILVVNKWNAISKLIEQQGKDLIGKRLKKIVDTSQQIQSSLKKFGRIVESLLRANKANADDIENELKNSFSEQSSEEDLEIEKSSLLIPTFSRLRDEIDDSDEDDE